jgi:osmotically-inducible protein OsmY
MKPSRLTFVLLLACLSLFGAGVATKPAAPAATGSKPAASKPAAKAGLSDSAIESDIRARFARSKVSADKFQVKVQAGVATLEGKTDVIQHKGSATRMAKSAGAKAVVNNIQISDTAKQKAAANLAKGKHTVELKRSSVTR